MTKEELINKIQSNRSFDLRDSEYYEPWDISDETIKDMADDFYYLLKDVLYYLAGKEEPVSEDFEKIVEEIAEPTILNAYGTKELARRLRNTICGTSVSEDLEEELDSYIKDNFTIDKEQLDRFGLDEKDYMYSMDKSDMLKMIRHFTNNYKVPTSDFLEEAAKLCVSDYFCITNEEDWDEHAVDALNIFKIAAEWQKTKDESTTEDLGNYINELSKQFPEVSFAKLSRIAIRVAKWQKEHLWKPADGEDLPKYDREVIVLTQPYPLKDSEYAVYFAHRPDPKGWDGKSIATGKIEHYTPKTYGKGGWNIPDVVIWLDLDIPKLEEE